MQDILSAQQYATQRTLLPTVQTLKVLVFLKVVLAAKSWSIVCSTE